jgi:hypothetical protein
MGIIKTLPHPLSLSRKEREEKPFSPGEKGWAEGAWTYRLH